MEEDTSQPSAPSNGANGEVVNLEDIQQNDDESFENFVRRLDAEYIEPVDSSAKSPESEWDTSLVNRPHLESTDVAVPSRDYHALLFTARVDLAEDQDLKLPWETGILKTIFDEESDIVSLPSQVLSVSGEVLGAWVDDSGASSSLEPKEKTLSWLSRDISLPVHACAVKVMPDRDFFQELEILWEHAIDKWLRVFEILGFPGLLGELLSLELQQPEGGRTRPMIRDAMGIKSPRTAIRGLWPFSSISNGCNLIRKFGIHGLRPVALITWRLEMPRVSFLAKACHCWRRFVFADLYYPFQFPSSCWRTHWSGVEHLGWALKEWTTIQHVL